MLNNHLKNKTGPGDLCLSEEELKRLYNRIPHNDIPVLNLLNMNAMNTLELLLVELLGTNEDISKFKTKYNIMIPVYVKSLIGKCLDLYTVRNKTSKLLQKIHRREK